MSPAEQYILEAGLKLKSAMLSYSFRQLSPDMQKLTREAYFLLTGKASAD